VEKSLQQTRLVSQGRSYKCCAGSKADKYSNRSWGNAEDETPSTISRWLQQYRRGGLSELLEEKATRQGMEIDGEMLTQLQTRLQEADGFKSYREIQQWIEQTFGKQVKYKTVHKTVRYRLKAKLKVPRPRSQAEPAGSESV